jgi:hypothetical protein
MYTLFLALLSIAAVYYLSRRERFSTDTTYTILAVVALALGLFAVFVFLFHING